MASELRVRCFIAEVTSSSEDHWNLVGERAEVARSLHDLVDVLEDASGDYTVKVMIHRKSDARTPP